MSRGGGPLEDELQQRARAAAEAAYCPYSQFPVGAAVETDQGVFVGCNVENASYGLSICAERVAIFAALAGGARRLTRLAVCCAKASDADPPGTRMPCGACRQVMAEFMESDCPVFVAGAGVWRIADLLPQAFQLENSSFLTRGTTSEMRTEKGDDDAG